MRKILFLFIMLITVSVAHSQSLSVAKRLLQEGKYSAAHKVAEQVLKRNPKDSQAKRIIDQCNEKADERFNEALEDAASKGIESVKRLMQDEKVKNVARRYKKAQAKLKELEVIPVPTPAPVSTPAPKSEVNVEDNKIYDIVDQQPTFNGNINSWLAANLKYPPVAAKDGIEGRVIVQFVVGNDGSIRSAQVVRGVDPYLDREALRVVNSMPKWIPGKQNGQTVNCKFTLPIVFRLN